MYLIGMDDGAIARALSTIGTYGYPILFFTSVAEGTFVLGFFAPGDMFAVLGGVLAARGDMRFGPVFATVSTGVILGTCLSYWIGARGGIALIERWGHRLRLSKERIARVETYFQAHGAKTVFVASFVAGMKNVAPALAGALRMSPVRFFFYNATGASLRTLLIMGVGYAFGENLDRVLAVVRSVNGWILLVAAALVVLLISCSLHRRRARKGRA